MIALGGPNEMSKSFPILQTSAEDQSFADYVFVDEQNRSKRLKIARACESCRRRKVRCDLIHSDGTGCSNCKRLRIDCIGPPVHSSPNPPSSFDKNYSVSPHEKSQCPSRDCNTCTEMHATQVPSPMQTEIPSTYMGSEVLWTPEPIPSQANLLHQRCTDCLDPSSLSPPYLHPFSKVEAIYSPLEALAIDPTGKATFMVHKENVHVFGREPSTSTIGLSANEDRMGAYPIRVQKDLLPPDPYANALLHIYFSDIHPYMPVINKASFFHQWRYARENMSLFLLECMFAAVCRLCEGRVIQDAPPGLDTSGITWYRRALDHLNDFSDCPRFSTVQGILILIKCNETMTGKGYFYRSWVMLNSAICMGIDCGLNKSTTRNRLSPAEKRTWQVVSMIDQLISTAHGRESQMSKANIDDTNDTAEAGDDKIESHILNNFAYLCSLLRLVRRATGIVIQWGTGFWPSDPRYPTLSQILDSWHDKLPTQLRIQLPRSLQEPFPLPKDHFAINLQIAFWMTTLLLYRPWLLHPEKSSSAEASSHISKAIQAAKAITLYVTAVNQQFGLGHFKYMLRGINFTIYACVAALSVLIHASWIDVDAVACFYKLSDFLELALSDSTFVELRESLQKIRAACAEYVSLSKSQKTMQSNATFAVPGYRDPLCNIGFPTMNTVPMELQGMGQMFGFLSQSSASSEAHIFHLGENQRFHSFSSSEDEGWSSYK